MMVNFKYIRLLRNLMTTWKRYSRVADLQLDTPNGYLFVQHARVNPDCGIPVYIVDDRVGVNLITNEAFRSQGKASFKDLQDCVVRFDSQDAEGLWDGSKHYPLEKTEISLSKDVHDKISEYDLPSLDRRTRLLHLYFHYPWNLEPQGLELCRRMGDKNSARDLNALIIKDSDGNPFHENEKQLAFNLFGRPYALTLNVASYGPVILTYQPPYQRDKSSHLELSSGVRFEVRQVNADIPESADILESIRPLLETYQRQIGFKFSPSVSQRASFDSLGMGRGSSIRPGMNKPINWLEMFGHNCVRVQLGDGLDIESVVLEACRLMNQSASDSSSWRRPVEYTTSGDTHSINKEGLTLVVSPDPDRRAMALITWITFEFDHSSFLRDLVESLKSGYPLPPFKV